MANNKKGIKNNEKTIFNINETEINRQLSIENLMKIEKNNPINPNEFLEPCIRGGKKILADSNKKSLIKSIYRRMI